MNTTTCTATTTAGKPCKRIGYKWTNGKAKGQVLCAPHAMKLGV